MLRDFFRHEIADEILRGALCGPCLAAHGAGREEVGQGHVEPEPPAVDAGEHCVHGVSPLGFGLHGGWRTDPEPEPVR